MYRSDKYSMYLWPIVAGMCVLCVHSMVGGFGSPKQPRVVAGVLAKTGGEPCGDTRGSQFVSGASREQTCIDIVLN